MPELIQNQDLLKSLACVALSPGLRSILIFDAPYTGLQRLADMLARLLGTTTDQAVRSHQLGPFENDDEVWGSFALPGKPPLVRLFAQERNATEFQLFWLPDLAALSQTAARTCTMLVGSDLAHLERHEQHQVWQTQHCWLAACARADVGRVSPHLLDRFALRLQWQDIDPQGSSHEEARVASLLASVPRDLPASEPDLPAPLLHQVELARYQRVDVKTDVLKRMMDYLPGEQVYPRREIALARFAVALARLAGDAALSAEHLEEAARLLGLNRQELAQDEGDSQQEDAAPAVSANADDQAQQPAPFQDMQAEPPQQRENAAPEQPVYLPETTASASLEAGTLGDTDPYPEDTALVEREAASLQLAFTRYAPSRSARGPIIGVEESETLIDLAIASTLITALRFQGIRRTPEQEQRQEIVFRSTDLRRYRRGAVVESLLMLILDYTSLGANQNWQEALLPYLSQAYTERAGVVLVKVGAEGAISDLQAEMLSVRNITVPGFGEALELGSGLATPLAHGLSLAHEKLRHLLQHGRSLVRAVTLLIITDGRGNVPLQVSQHNSVQGPILGVQGVEDALKEAAHLRTLPRIEALLFNPQPQYYPELPGLMAEALGAKVQIIPLADEARGEEDGV